MKQGHSGNFKQQGKDLERSNNDVQRQEKMEWVYKNKITQPNLDTFEYKRID